jgi:hypothetical protein
MTHQNLPAEPPPEVHSHRRTMLWVARALTYFVYAYVVLTEIVLLLGFVLLLFGANPDPAFVQWAYRALDRAMEPFRGIFTPIELGETSGNVEAVLDTSILFAMLIYGLVGWGLRELIDWLTSRSKRLEQAEWDAQYRDSGPTTPYPGPTTPYGGPPSPYS